MTYRQAHETPRCGYCGGADFHTLGCYSQTEQYRDAVTILREASIDARKIETYWSETLGCRVTVPED